jgi:hypothetical protein
VKYKQVLTLLNCAFYIDPYIVFLPCVTNKMIIQHASLTFSIHHYMLKLSDSILNLDLFKMYKTIP